MKLESKITKESIRYAETIAINACKGFYDEDILSCAREGLVVAVRKFDGSSSFKSWLRLKVNEKVIGEIRRKRGRTSGIRRPIRPEFVRLDPDSLELSRNGTRGKVIFKDLLWKLQRQLTKKERRALKLRLTLGLKDAEIAVLDGVGLQAISLRFIKIRRKARRLFCQR